MIDQKFIENIPRDFYQGVMYFVRDYYDFIEYISSNQNEDPFEIYLEYYLALESYLKANNYKKQLLKLGENKQQNRIAIEDFYNNLNDEFQKILTINNIEEIRHKYNVIFNNVFKYEFSEGDVDRIQELINELRDIISRSELFTSEHQQRILRRLERLQSEMHKKVSDLDRFWGLIGDAGVAIGKFGKDAKPIVDRIKEISDIIWRTQARAEELPSGSHIPFITSGKDDE